MRRVICSVLRLALRIYFRRIEVTGLQNVPEASPVIFVLNHPNALVDPAFLLCLTPRRVSFLAKAPLFRMPVIGYFVRVLDSLPVYRQQDHGEDVSRNQETFAAARRLLAGGGTIGICPEGVSHDEPRLKPLKSGTARIALGAVSDGQPMDLQIVPVGLYYTRKTSFRSSALLHFGKPLPVQPTTLEANGAPPREAVRELSHRIEEAMREVILIAEQEEALTLIARAERIFSAAEANGPEEEQSLSRELQLMQRFLAGYAYHRTHSPDRIAHLIGRINRYENELSQAGIDSFDLTLPPSAAMTILALIARILGFAVVAPFALFGAVVHYPAYRLVGYLARRLSHEAEDVVSTFKIVSAMLFFPLSWIAVALAAEHFGGWLLAALVLAITPLCGYATIQFIDEFDSFVGGVLALTLYLTRRRAFVRLLAERAAIRREILELGSERISQLD